MNDPTRPSLLERLSSLILREPGDREQLAQLPLALATRLAAGEVRRDRLGVGPREHAVHEVVQAFVELVAGHETSASLSSRRARNS